METIKLLFHINAPRHKVFEALATIDGLAGWWTNQTTGDVKAGGIIEFRFGPQFLNKMRVLELKPGEWVRWECVEGPSDWIGNKISFQLDENDGKTRVRFEHSDWKEADDFYASCSFSWGRYMESLR